MDSLFLLSCIFLQKVEFLLFSVGLFLFFHDLTGLLQRIGTIYYLFIDGIYYCFFVFYPIRRIYIDPPPNLFHGIYNSINEHSQIWNCYRSSMIQTQFNIWKEVIETSSAVTSFALSLIMISKLLIYEYIIRSSSFSLKDIKLTAIGFGFSV